MPEKSGIFYLCFGLFLYLPDIASITRFISLRSDFGATTSMLSMWCKSSCTNSKLTFISYSNTAYSSVDKSVSSLCYLCSGNERR